MSNITSLLRFLLPEKHVDSFLPHWSFSFYHFQFFSNLFKYSVSNFLSSYLYNIFTIYLPDNSPLLKSFSSATSNFSCYLTFTSILPLNSTITNFIQLVSLQPVDRFSQTKLHWKAPNEGYLHICGRYKSNNKWVRYQAISSCKSFVC